MNSQHTLEQRLQSLQGSGSAPEDLWARIEPRLQASAQPRRQRLWPRWAAIAAVACLVAVAVIRPTPTPVPAVADDYSPSNTIAAEVAALDQSQRGFTDVLPTLVHSGGPIPAVYIGPELQAILQAREQVRMALEQQPDSTYLLHQLATLDQWQYRLLRQMGSAPAASV